MQSDIKQIYKLAAERTFKSEQMYKDLGNFVQQEIANVLKRPNSLITKVKGLGYWYLRKKKMKDFIRMYPPYYDIEGFSDFESEAALKNFENKQELYLTFKARLLDYDRFLEKKAFIKQLRNEFDKISEGKEDSNQSSQDKSA